MDLHEFMFVRPVRDLDVGKTFLGDELIIAHDERSLATISCQEGLVAEKQFDIVVNRYVVSTSADDKVRRIHYTGYNEVYVDDENHAKYKRQLQQRGLWREQE